MRRLWLLAALWAALAGLSLHRAAPGAQLGFGLPANRLALRSPPRGGSAKRLTARPARGAEQASAPPAPGPWSIPGLGSLSVVWALLVLKVPLQKILRDLRAEYGPLFVIRTGPVSQVWVGDTEVLRRVYEVPECCGRPATFADPFGDFLFLTREPEKAAVIKQKQKVWLEENLSSKEVRTAVEEAMQRLWPHLDKAGRQAWPAEAIKLAMYSAVTCAILGKDGLMSDEELIDFMAATKEYSEMRGKAKQSSKAEGGPAPPPGAEQIKEIILRALARAGREDADVALPLVVSASIGGAEIFPTLLHWIFLFFAREPKRQEAAAKAASGGDNEALMRELYAVLRRTAYSVALGPPRKVLADAQVEGYQIPEGALLFAMHPAIVDEALGREPSAEDDFSAYAFGVGPRSCLGQSLTEALLPAAVGAILRRYRVALADPAESAAPEGELRGQLIHPKDPPELCWHPREAK